MNAQAFILTTPDRPFMSFKYACIVRSYCSYSTQGRVGRDDISTATEVQAVLWVGMFFMIFSIHILFSHTYAALVSTPPYKLRILVTTKSITEKNTKRHISFKMYILECTPTVYSWFHC